MRKVLIPILLVLFPVVFALNASFSTYPLYPSPGDTVRITMNLSGYATNVKMKLNHPLFKDEYWREIGDVAGASQLYFDISLPSNLKPGFYQVPVLLKFTENNKDYETTYLIPLRVSPRDGDVRVSLFGIPAPGVEGTFQLNIQVLSDPIYRSVLHIEPSLEGPLELGTLEGNKTVLFRAIPNCYGGVQEFNVILTGFREGNVVVEKRFAVPCAPTDEVEVESNLPLEVNQGVIPVNVTVRNPQDLPRTFHVVISSNGKLSGEVEKTITIDGRKSKRLNLLVEPGEDDDLLFLTIKVLSTDKNYTFTFSARVAKEPKIVAFLREVKNGEATVEIANVGEGEAKNVLASSGEATRFIGTLSGGDYDTVDFPIEGNILDVMVVYTFQGREVERTFHLPVKVRNKGSVIPWVLVAGAALVAVWFWRRKGGGPHSDGT